MKILQIINSLGTAGAEKLILESLPIYRKLGIEMDLLVLWDDGNQPFLKALNELNCCKIIKLKVSNNIRDLYHPLNIFKLRKYISEYDIAHVHLFPAQYFSVFANMLNKKKAKLIFTEHNTSNTRIKSKKYKLIEQFIYKRYAALICISQEINEIYEQYLKGIVPQFVIQNGIDLSKMHNAKPIFWQEVLPENKYSDGDKVILQVSGFRPQKDQKALIDSLNCLDETYKLVLVGSGETEDSLKAYVRDTHLDARVIFLGQRMDIPDLLHSADYIVLSSHYEGLSLSSIEGMASAKPFLASDVPGLSNVVKGAGVLFEESNSEMIAKEIDALQKDEAYRNQIIQGCLQRAKEYSIDNMVAKHIQLYQKVLANG